MVGAAIARNEDGVEVVVADGTGGSRVEFTLEWGSCGSGGGGGCCARCSCGVSPASTVTLVERGASKTSRTYSSPYPSDTSASSAAAGTADGDKPRAVAGDSTDRSRCAPTGLAVRAVLDVATVGRRLGNGTGRGAGARHMARGES